MTGQEAIRNEILALRCLRGDPGAFEEVVRLRERPLLDHIRRLGFAVGSLFGFAWTALSASILRKGSFDRRRHATAMTGLTWGFVIALITLLMLLGGQIRDRVLGISMVLNGTVFLIIGAVFLIAHRIEQAELKTREKLLEVEYRLAGIEEELKKKG